MCVSLNRTTLPSQIPTDYAAKEKLEQKPLNLDLPKDFHQQVIAQDEMNISNFSKPQKFNYPSIPIYQDPNSTDLLRMTESSPNSAKIEFGRPDTKALLTIKARNEERYEGLHVITESKVSFDSPYLKSEARNLAKDTIKNHLVNPLREAIGKTAADTTLGAVTIATALVSAKHLPDGHLKLDIPTKNFIANEDLKVKLILGYGDGENLKATGVEIKDKYQYNDKNIDLKATYRTDREVDGIKDVTSTEVEAIVRDKNEKWDSGVFSLRIGHDSVRGSSAGIFYNKQF